MTEDKAERENAALLGLIGQVEPPAPGVLQDAREALWSVVATQMLSAGAAADAEGMTAGEAGSAQARRTDPSGRPSRRRRTDPGS